MEEKIKCLATEKVKYTQRVDYIMQLPVPMDAALNKGKLLSVRPGCHGPPSSRKSAWVPCRSRTHCVPCSPSQRPEAGPSRGGRMTFTLRTRDEVTYGCVSRRFEGGWRS